MNPRMVVPAKAAGNGQVAQRWMEMVLGEKFSRDFAAELRAGTALCALAGKVFKALGMKEQVLALAPHAGAAEARSESRDPRYAADRPPPGSTQRIRAYLRYVCALLELYITERGHPERRETDADGLEWLGSACDLLGVDVDDMFEPDDLLLYKNMDRGARRWPMFGGVS